MLRVLEPFQSPASSCIRLGTLPILSQYELTGRLHSYAGQHPCVTLTIYEAEETELMEGFRSGRFDLIIAREHMIPADTYQTYLLASDRLVAVMSKQHPLSAKKAVTISMLEKEPLIMMNPYTSVYQLCIKLFHNAGIDPVILRTARMESIISAVSLNQGISLLPLKNLQLFHHEELIFCPFEPAVDLPVVLAAKRQGILPALHLNFIEALTTPSIL